METICIKLEKRFASDVAQTIKKYHYTTKTELIREALRDKLKQLQKEQQILRVKQFYGASKRKTTDEQLHVVREQAAAELEKELG